jgi:hypothetical protein
VTGSSPVGRFGLVASVVVVVVTEGTDDRDEGVGRDQ